MNDKNEDPFGMATMVATWMKSMGDLWGNAATQWGTTHGQQQADGTAGNAADAKARATMAAAMKNWQTMVGAMAAPESIAALFKGSGAMPEVFLKLAQTSMGSMTEMHQKMIERLGRIGDSVEAYQFRDIDENMFRV